MRKTENPSRCSSNETGQNGIIYLSSVIIHLNLFYMILRVRSIEKNERRPNYATKKGGSSDLV